jgi:hypothetical protein
MDNVKSKISNFIVFNFTSKLQKKEMQQLKLFEDVFDSLQKGKLTTIRKGRRSIDLGELRLESVETKRHEIVEVITVYYTRLKQVNTEDLKNDGFRDHLDMWEQMKRFYPDIQLEDEVTVVKFKMKERC